MTDKKTVLIIDDDPDTVTYFSSLLEDNGYATVTAQNGADGIERVKQARPDLITLDITMPETSGVRCYRDLREHEAWRERRCTSKELWQYAGICRVANVMRPYLESLT